MGSLVLQVFGDGPVKVAVAEVQPDLSLRATAKVVGEVPADARLPDMVNVNNKGRCAITLDPKDKHPGQQPYQGVVPLYGDQARKAGQAQRGAGALHAAVRAAGHRLILAADDKVAAGLLIQRLPTQGEANMSGTAGDDIGLNEDYNRIAILAAS
jgi:molecular chaperone Hsp33